MKGIFTLECRETGNQYLAAADDLDQGMRHLRDCLDRGECSDATLQKEWNQYGSAAFEWGVPEQISEPDSDDAIINEVIEEWLNILEDVEYLGYSDRAGNEGIQE